jgi:hypothetical protein
VGWARKTGKVGLPHYISGYTGLHHTVKQQTKRGYLKAMTSLTNKYFSGNPAWPAIINASQSSDRQDHDRLMPLFCLITVSAAGTMSIVMF